MSSDERNDWSVFLDTFSFFEYLGEHLRYTATHHSFSNQTMAKNVKCPKDLTQNVLSIISLITDLHQYEWLTTSMHSLTPATKIDGSLVTHKKKYDHLTNSFFVLKQWIARDHYLIVWNCHGETTSIFPHSVMTTFLINISNEHVNITTNFLPPSKRTKNLLMQSSILKDLLKKIPKDTIHG